MRCIKELTFTKMGSYLFKNSVIKRGYELSLTLFYYCLHCVLFAGIQTVWTKTSTIKIAVKARPKVTKNKFQPHKKRSAASSNVCTLWLLLTSKLFQKQSSEGSLWHSCSQKVFKILEKTPTMETFFERLLLLFQAYFLCHQCYFEYSLSNEVQELYEI